MKTEGIEKPPAEATISELEELAHLGRTRLYSHIRRAGIKGKKGRYNVERVLQAVLDHRREDNRNRSAGADPAKSYLLKLKCKRLEIDISLLQGKLIEAARIERAIAAAMTRLRGRLLGIGSRAAAEAHAVDSEAEVQAVIDRHILEALEDLASHDGFARSDT